MDWDLEAMEAILDLTLSVSGSYWEVPSRGGRVMMSDFKKIVLDALWKKK